MRELKLQSTVQIASNVHELPAADSALLKRAKKAAEGAYAPYSNFKVGAAVLLQNGEVVIGSNQENAAYPATMCGERNAIFSAAAQFPEVPIKAVAITVISKKGNVNRPVPPCGSCRQVIYEQEVRHRQNIRIILQGDRGDIYLVRSVKDILPLLFDASYL